MKLLLKSLCVAFVLTVILSMIPFEARCQNISNEVFRLHILANSDNEADQELKLKVRDAILNQTENLYQNATSKTDAIKLTQENLYNIIDLAEQTIQANGYDYTVNAKVTKTYFNTRYYGDVTMPSGFYDALQIEIGSGNGKNWWCVMYPSLCVGSVCNSDILRNTLNDDEMDIVIDDGDFKFKFKIVEYYETLKNQINKIIGDKNPNITNNTNITNNYKSN